MIPCGVKASLTRKSLPWLMFNPDYVWRVNHTQKRARRTFKIKSRDSCDVGRNDAGTRTHGRTHERLRAVGCDGWTGANQCWEKYPKVIFIYRYCLENWLSQVYKTNCTFNDFFHIMNLFFFLFFLCIICMWIEVKNTHKSQIYILM